MPKFELSHDDGVDLATWLHYQVTVTVARQDYQRPNVFSGDPKAGEAFFNGPVGKCNTCHSVTGDLKGIGQKAGNDAGNMQASIRHPRPMRSPSGWWVRSAENASIT